MKNPQKSSFASGRQKIKRRKRVRENKEKKRWKERERLFSDYKKAFDRKLYQ